MELNFLQSYDFFTGVPDSQLKPLCDYLMDTYGVSEQHIIAANEGNCAALAAGYHLATGKIPIVYLQNSGIGNIINPVASLLNNKVYGIPCIFVIGWRGEPGLHDEPQHLFQGEITLELLKVMNIQYFIVDKNVSEEECLKNKEKFDTLLSKGESVAYVVKKDALHYSSEVYYENGYTLLREKSIESIVDVAKDDIIISTTGKISRELYEIRMNRNQSHKFDFLTVGSMGHSSSIALGIALQKKETTVWCIDGDGAMLMHMGALAVMGANSPHNVIHVLLNNEAHETVGGIPTTANKINFVQVAKGCGYPYAICVDTLESLNYELSLAKERAELAFIEVRVALGARKDLGRPKTTAQKNKEDFMIYLNECK